MKFALGFILLISTASDVAGQTKWTKSSSTALEDECIAYLSKTYKTLDENAKETIALCFSKEIKSKYPNKDDYESLSDRELGRIKNTYIQQCAKTSLGVDLKITEQRIEEKPTKENLIGHWQDDESDFFLNPDGRVSITFNDDKSTEAGTWTIQADVLTLHVNRKLFGKKEKEFKIFMFQKDQFLYQSQKTMENQTVRRVN